MDGWMDGWIDTLASYPELPLLLIEGILIVVVALLVLFNTSTFANNTTIFDTIITTTTTTRGTHMKRRPAPVAALPMAQKAAIPPMQTHEWIGGWIHR